MRSAVQELITVLGQETAIAKELVEQLQKDQQSIIKQDIPAIEESNLRKEELVLRFQALEGARGGLSERLASALDLQPDEARVSMICPRLGPDGDALEAAAEKLRAVIGSMAELVAVSRGFLEQSILGIRSLLALIQSLRTPEPQTYGASGRIDLSPDPQAVAVRREV